KGTQMLENAVKLFRAYHPGIKIELIVEDFGNGSDVYSNYQKVAAEIMAGKGPDILLIDEVEIDVEKAVRQGVFADMEPFFEADGFDWEPYNQTILDGGVWDGRRYVIPLAYDFPLLVSTRTALEETGFDVDACKDYTGFLEETRRVMEDPSQTRALFYLPISYLVTSWMMENSGIQYADFNHQTIDLSRPEVEATFQWMREHEEKYAPEMIGMSGLRSPAAVRDGEALWSIDLMGAATTLFYHYAALKTVDEPVMMPIRDVNGGIQALLQYPVAVRANSENLQIAYEFLKILLSKEVQGAYAGQFGGEQLSVLNQANTDYYYHSDIWVRPGDWKSFRAGTEGFTSTINPVIATDWPTEEEYAQFTALTQEITGTYYTNSLGLRRAMRPFLYEGADYDETIRDAQRTLEINISE
ncbi:MAG: extracellular solute-binding protein, partial [Oscillospiraceae bacterium]|nr:extracellular solute-binding protein [Oscillospiraceae bacterium]